MYHFFWVLEKNILHTPLKTLASRLSLFCGNILFLFADWFDGLHTFTRNICHRSWLGGWFMPQKKSYFALQLPMGWWIFGLDLALHGDVDVYQFEFFSKLARKTVYTYVYLLKALN